jgi:hypothetical protein
MLNDAAREVTDPARVVVLSLYMQWSSVALWRPHAALGSARYSARRAATMPGNRDNRSVRSARTVRIVVGAAAGLKCCARACVGAGPVSALSWPASKSKVSQIPPKSDAGVPTISG